MGLAFLIGIKRDDFGYLAEFSAVAVVGAALGGRDIGAGEYGDAAVLVRAIGPVGCGAGRGRDAAEYGDPGGGARVFQSDGVSAYPDLDAAFDCGDSLAG